MNQLVEEVRCYFEYYHPSFTITDDEIVAALFLGFSKSNVQINPHKLNLNLNDNTSIIQSTYEVLNNCFFNKD